MNYNNDLHMFQGSCQVSLSPVLRRVVGRFSVKTPTKKDGMEHCQWEDGVRMGVKLETSNVGNCEQLFMYKIC